MIDNSELKIVGFHLELTNRCALKCHKCERTKLIASNPKAWKNIDLSLADLITFLDIDLTNIRFELCGTYGDPIYYPYLMKFMRFVRDRGASILLVTNGSYRTQRWWNEFCSMLTTKDTVRFSIDGMPENFTQYRVNGDWPSIKIGIDATVKSEAMVQWSCIPFSFNESMLHEIEQYALAHAFPFAA